MKICMVLDRVFPPDIRVEKEARELIKAGHELYLLSKSAKDLPEEEIVNGIKVHRFSSHHIYFILYSLSFEDLMWKKKIHKLVKDESIEVIHVHDLALVKTAKGVAKKFDIPIVADLHENYPEAVRVYKNQKRSLLSRVFGYTMPMWRWKQFETKCLKDVNHIITVANEAKRHYINDCKVPHEKITVVMNTEDLDDFGKLKIEESVVDEYKDDFVISYIGGFGPHRGIDTAIKAMPEILNGIPNAKLLLVGTGSKQYESEMNKLCQDLNVENTVIFTGWVDFKLVPSYIELSDICLVPHHSSGHTDTTIPHKIFQYMFMKKPIIVTDCPPLRKIIEETDSGLVIPSGDFDKMAKTVIQLYDDPEKRHQMGINGLVAVEVKFNWKIEAKKLCELYRRIEDE